MYGSIAVFALGLIFGSFANVIIMRLNTGESLIFGSSRCFFCGRNLRWFELIPVLSFFFLRGHCRTCGGKISWQYPVVEILSGLLFLLLWLEPSSNQLGQNSVLTITAILFFWLLLIISVYDLRHKIIPNSLVYSAIIVAVLFLILDIGILDLLPSIFSGLGLFAFFAALWAVSRGAWMGFGDAKLGLALGLMLGWPAALLALLFSFWFGAIFGSAWAFLRGINGMSGSNGWRGVQIPFAPFLFIGGLIAYLWGDKIISWYASLI